MLANTALGSVRGIAQEHCATLGIPANATSHEIRRAYHRLAREYHPDRKGGEREHEYRLHACVRVHVMM